MSSKNDIPGSGLPGKIGRGLLQLGGGIPGVGSFLSLAASSWSEHDQDRVNNFFKQWLKMLEDEIKEQAQTVVEIMARLDLQDDRIIERIESKEYQTIVRKAFRDWAGAESEEKRQWIRNILSNAAASDIASDDVIKLFIDWMKTYSEMHFHVIAAVYNSAGITRGGIWEKLEKEMEREDSPEAGLFRLLIRDLSMGGIIRQHRQRDYYGNFIAKTPQKRPAVNSGSRAMESAFDNSDQYELSELGQQFVHYAMTDLPLKIESNNDSEENAM